MKNRSILISGAGVAGPALAWWLNRHGFRCTVVERAPALREGGYAIDFRGDVHLGLLERMGILDDIRAAQTNMGAVSYVSAAGKTLSSLPADFMSGDLEVLRGDLVRILYEATRGETEYLFGDSIRELDDDADGVTVSFERGASRRFDLVVGADGLHSNVRALAFGDAAGAVHDLGYYLAIFTTANHLGLDHCGQFYSVPGRSAGMYSARANTEAKALFYFASPPLDYDRRDRSRQQAILAERFADVGWAVPTMLAAMDQAPDFYFDSISQVRLDRWSRGRVVLLGDAGYCPSPWSGQGNGLAMVGAYVLAGELKAACGDPATAFTAYEARMRTYVAGCQKLAHGAGDWVAPKSRWKIWRRDLLYRMLPHSPWKSLMAEIPRSTASAISLEAY